MSGLLLIGDDYTYHNIIIIIIIFIKAHYVEFDISTCLNLHVWLFPCNMTRVYSHPPTRENETWLWTIPFRNKELAAQGAESSGTLELGGMCKCVMLFEDRKKAKTCTATSSLCSNINTGWKRLCCYGLTYTAKKKKKKKSHNSLDWLDFFSPLLQIVCDTEVHFFLESLRKLQLTF